MAWSFEFKSGLLWAIVVSLLVAVAIWAEVVTHTLLPLLIPIVGYIAFAAWVARIKK